jgi:hypothetical protein
MKLQMIDYVGLSAAIVVVACSFSIGFMIGVKPGSTVEEKIDVRAVAPAARYVPRKPKLEIFGASPNWRQEQEIQTRMLNLQNQMKRQ